MVDPESSLQRACHTLAQLGRADGVVRLCLTCARHFKLALEEGQGGRADLYDHEGGGFAGHGRGRGGVGGSGNGSGGGGGGVGGNGAARWCGFLLDDPTVKADLAREAIEACYVTILDLIRDLVVSCSQVCTVHEAWCWGSILFAIPPSYRATTSPATYPPSSPTITTQSNRLGLSGVGSGGGGAGVVAGALITQPVAVADTDADLAIGEVLASGDHVLHQRLYTYVEYYPLSTIR